MRHPSIHRTAALAALATLSACQPDEPPPPACHMEVVAHLAPLPAPPDPFAYQYSEVAARDGIAYLGASAGAGVQVLDVAAGQSISVLDAGLAANINSVAAAGHLLAFAAGNNGIVVYDITNPRAPARRAHRRDPVSYCHTVFIHADVVYCSTSSAAEPHLAFYRVVTPADPAAPLQIEPAGSYTAPVTPEEEQAGADVLVHDVFVHERDGRTLAYLAYWERGLHIVDVTDPGQPRLVGATAPTPTRWTHSVWVDGAFAYVGEESYKGLVRVFDVSRPEAPAEVGQLRSAQGDAISAHNVQVADGVVYASWYQDGLRAFAARGAAAPGEIGYFHTWNGADNRQNPGPFDARFAGNWDVFVDGDRIYAADMQTGLWVLAHDRDAGACPSDRPRGTSAFAKAGRPPFGWNGFQPRRVRPDRTIPVLARLTSVDPYFPVTDAIALGLRPRILVGGARMVGPTEMLPGPGRPTSYRFVSALAELPAEVGAAGLTLGLALDDEGVERSLRQPIEVLAAAPPNRDFEPNEDPWVSGVVRPDPAGQAAWAGTLDETDRRDVYTLAPIPGAPALRFRLVTGGASGDPSQPTALLVVSRSASSEQEFGDPARQAIAEGWEQIVTVPAGETAALYLGVESLTPAGDGAVLPYRLEISRP